MPQQSHLVDFRRRLLRWFRRAGRPFPWRSTRDPYRVLVSEIMLQQTQADRVVPFFHRFVDRYPSVHSLAAARPKAVREAWEGLGYYRRSRNLHRAARTIVRRHRAEVPQDGAVLADLPGIGPYTAAAVRAFAYEQRVIPVDTNIRRVLQRAFGIRRAHTVRGRRQTERLATALLPRTRAAVWRFNQALMDLGAVVCTARAPRCGICAVRPACRTGRERTEG